MFHIHDDLLLLGFCPRLLEHGTVVLATNLEYGFVHPYRVAVYFEAHVARALHRQQKSDNEH